jgi:hypothetical protein
MLLIIPTLRAGLLRVCLFEAINRSPLNGMGGSRGTNRGTPAGQWRKTPSTAAREHGQNDAEGRICTIMHKKKFYMEKKLYFCNLKYYDLL